MSDCLQPHGLDPAKLLCPWDSLGKNIGVGCPPPGDLPSPGIEPPSSALQAGSLLLSHQGSPSFYVWALSKQKHGKQAQQAIPVHDLDGVQRPGNWCLEEEQPGLWTLVDDAVLCVLWCLCPAPQEKELENSLVMIFFPSNKCSFLLVIHPAKEPHQAISFLY